MVDASGGARGAEDSASGATRGLGGTGGAGAAAGDSTDAPSGGGGSTSKAGDASAGTDASAGAGAAGATAAGGSAGAAGVSDASGGVAGGGGAAAGGAPDASTTLDQHVHIFVSNTCVMSVDPKEITVPAGSTVRIDWHNHSADYPVTVWMSYGGGYTDLPTGSTWDEPIEHCANINPYTAYADISTACSRFRFFIRCL